MDGDTLMSEQIELFEIKKPLMDSYLSNMPKLKKLRDDVTKGSKSGTIPALDGRRLHIRSPHAALNTLLQGAGAII